VQRLRSSHVPKSCDVCISTIQRMYAMLQGKELDESAEEENPAERSGRHREPLPVVYNDHIPIEYFDFIVIDECHRSIYNLWLQVLEYFDAFLIGLTATPDNRTYGFFERNVVSEYTHEKAVADGVNVGNEVYLIETKVTKEGGHIPAGIFVQKREKLTRAHRWEQQDEDQEYQGKQLDRSVVNLDQIRTVVRGFRDKLPEIFPGRGDDDGQFEVPKTLVFAKTDSHADDVIQMIRKEFGESSQFCKKITYKTEEDPKSVLAQFRNEYYPRIAVTVDMIATGTDVRPLECLLFMRDVRSKGYFEQMKGRGTRTQTEDELRKVTPTAKSAKTHFVIVDAVGVTTSIKTTSPTLNTKPSIPFKDLAYEIMMGSSDADSVSSLAARMARLDRQLSPAERERIAKETGGTSLRCLVSNLFGAIDGDAIDTRAVQLAPGDDVPPAQLEAATQQAQQELVVAAAKPLTGNLINLMLDLKRQHEQTVDEVNLDEIQHAGWADATTDQAEELTSAFEQTLRDHQDELTALTIYFQQPQRRHEATLTMIREVLDKLKASHPALAISRVYDAYTRLDTLPDSAAPLSELTALVALIRRVCGIDATLSPFAETVRRNFRDWILRKNAGEPFSSEQADWLKMIRDHVCSSVHFSRKDLDYAPFDAKGGLGRMHQLFQGQMDTLISELNKALVA
jgi:type I restriction enzyme R subunit